MKELLSIGIQPDILICRSDRAVPANERAKIALFCNVPEKSRYFNERCRFHLIKFQALLKSQGLDDYICKRFSLNCPEANLSEWEQVIYEEANPAGEVTIGMVGKYIELPDAYKSVIEALKHGGLKNRVTVNIKLIDSQDVETRGVEILKDLGRYPDPRRLRLSWALKVKSPLRAMRVKTIFLIWAFAWGCRLR
ncbi:CTP synthetase [Salmonella enterica subsp. enterica]|uniref:CTP synthetase n=1 Tax=Salmonella enterica I TaxID=59201 RepID=A0A3S5DMI4_SALET|nr:CTP synthetase [Salmonella enterica subsp. enterica]